MNILEIIEKKKTKQELSVEEIDFFVQNYTNSSIPDYQISSLLMAIRLNGMTDDETFHLTKSMIESGDVVAKLYSNKEITEAVIKKTEQAFIIK